MINVTITTEAMDYILEKYSDSITVDMMTLGGCGGEHYSPAVSLGRPDSPEKYDLSDANGIKIYIFKGAEAKPDGIEISLEVERKYYKNLVVSGLLHDESSLD